MINSNKASILQEPLIENKSHLEMIKPIKALGKNIPEKVFDLLCGQKMSLQERIRTALEKNREEIIINIKFDLKNTATTIFEVDVIASPKNFLEELKKAINTTIAREKIEKETEYEITSMRSEISFGEYERRTNITII